MRNAGAIASPAPPAFSPSEHLEPLPCWAHLTPQQHSNKGSAQSALPGGPPKIQLSKSDSRGTSHSPGCGSHSPEGMRA